mmetsp:Transcript_90022/g.280179  ORF Transcript_90022/g.280179 Transcript_90022/m.280179 type:complete len:811 (-) Transcript_90022:102-2534(-)|eukprot:CAMPEP_0204604138 /NCGR_PEP_ID=MMETSP0661-20131031/57667_1 /ASSEMBLY_ACC=CAM_ASM_000606 /TAXON_ID=109239 /ORGANISM="Alexandrium margalefi, Strain AMGDE01CS-322" /LENGTH=810 /DNA_ID=CAMNT_0051615269 /DNA_START=82 /DNA_END=2514 /DNA_ORIENTATION=-
MAGLLWRMACLSSVTLATVQNCERETCGAGPSGALLMQTNRFESAHAHSLAPSRKAHGEGIKLRLVQLESETKQMAKEHVSEALRGDNGTNATGRVGQNDSRQAPYIKQIWDEINRTIVQGMIADSNEDQNEVNTHHGYIAECKTDLSIKNTSKVKQFKASAKAKAEAEAACLVEKASLTTTRQQVCAAAHAHFVANLKSLGCKLGDKKTAAVLKEHLDCVKRFKLKIPPGDAQYKLCRDATDRLDNKTADCNTKKDEHHTAHCVFRAEASSACSEYDHCYTTERTRYLSTKASVMVVEAGRKKEAVAIARIRCYLKVIELPAWQLQGSAGANELAKCNQINTSVEQAKFDINYPAVAAAYTCDLVGNNSGSSAPQGGCPSMPSRQSAAPAFCDAFECPVHYNKVANAQDIPQASKDHCCRLQPSVSAMIHISGFVDAAGEVRMVGFNMGEMGDGTRTSHHTPIRLTTLGGKAVHVAGGPGTTVWVMADGTARAAGLNAPAMQLGIGSPPMGPTGPVFSLTPEAVLNVQNVVDACVGAMHAVYLLADGTVWGAGANEHGQLGVGASQPSPWQIQGFSKKVKGISCGTFFSTFLMEDGSVQSLGGNKYGELGDGSTTKAPQPVTMSGITTAIQVAAGSHHVLVLLSDGSVKATGLGDNGQRGDSSTEQVANLPKTVTVTGVKQVAAGSHTSYFLLNDGSVMASGSNKQKQIDSGSELFRSVPVKIPGVEGVVQVSASGNADASGHGRPGDDTTMIPGKEHVLFLLEDGEVKGAGDNSEGQLGEGKQAESYSGASPATVRANAQSTAPLDLA